MFGLKKLEQQLLDAFGDKLDIETVFATEPLSITTTAYWDGEVREVTVLDLEPFAQEIIRRVHDS